MVAPDSPADQPSEDPRENPGNEGIPDELWDAERLATDDASRSVPREHALRRFFNDVTRKAFSSFRSLHDPQIERHICDEVLGDFVHMDRIYRLRSREGRPLTEISEMALQTRDARSGVERDLEVHQHVGDYALFMAGLFPEFIEGKGRRAEKPLLAYVGSVLMSMDRPRDYYIVEGSSAYSHVSHLYKKLEPERAGIFHRLASRFDEYLDVMGMIRNLIRDNRSFQGDEDIEIIV